MIILILLKKDPIIHLESFLNPNILVNTVYSTENLKDIAGSGKDEIFPIFNLSEIHYSPKPFAGSEPLMYVILYVEDHPIKAVVGGGISGLFLGPEGLELINKLGLKINKKTWISSSRQYQY